MGGKVRKSKSITKAFCWGIWRNQAGNPSKIELFFILRGIGGGTSYLTDGKEQDWALQ